MGYTIYKTDKKIKFQRKTSFNEGYTFRGRPAITMYEKGLIKEVLIKKINNAFKNIMSVLLSVRDDDDDDETRTNELEIRIETLRALLIDKYFPFIGNSRTNAYLSKLEEIEDKIYRKENKKSRRR